MRRRLNVSSFEHTFANFKSVLGAEKALAAFRALEAEPAGHMLLCIGGVGCGKTHLCEALTLSWAEQGIKYRLVVWADFVKLLKSTFSGDLKGRFDEIFTNYQKAPRLIIDDVGMGGASDKSWEWGLLEELINYRSRERLATVVTTNLDVTQLPDRVVSRFRDKDYARIVVNEAGDYRPQKLSS